ncbi:MAG TPA: sulfite exporter TauE/SafE family protein [Micromonosporaceae bacterium]
MTTLAAVFLVMYLAALTQTVTGFGFALVGVPLLAVVTDPRTAVVGSALVGIPLSVMTAARDRSHVRWRPAALLLGTAILTIPLGVLILRDLNPRLLTLGIAVVVIGCTLIVWRSPRLPGNPGAVAGAGLLAGVLGAATNMNGPPLVATLRSLDWPPRPFRATLAAVFTGTGVVNLLGFTVAGQVTRTVLLVTAVSLPAMAAGWLTGDKVFSRIDSSKYRWVVLISLVGCSAMAAARALSI